jgi:hypothetical protein
VNSPIYSRTRRLRQDIIRILADALLNWSNGDGLPAAEVCDAVARGSTRRSTNSRKIFCAIKCPHNKICRKTSSALAAFAS